MNPRKNRKRAIPNDVVIFVDHSMAIPKQIDMILKNLGKNHAYLAQILDKKESEISKWMNGTHNFTLKTISKIEDKLGEHLIACFHELDTKYKSTGAGYTIADFHYNKVDSNEEIIKQCSALEGQIIKIDKRKQKLQVSLKPELISKTPVSPIY